MSVTEDTRRTYGGLQPPASPGIFGLALIPSLAGIAGLVLAMLIAMVAGFLTALGAVTVWVLLWLPFIARTDGRPWAAGRWHRARARRAQRRGLNTYRAGLVGATADGTYRLPGIAGSIEAWNVSADALGRPFGLLELRSTRQWAVAVRVDPDGGAMIGQEALDLRVAYFGELLALAGRTGGVRQVSVTIETQPDSGALLRAHVARITAPDAPEFAKRVLAAAAEELPLDVSETTGMVTVTYSERDLGIKTGGNARERAQAAADIIGRLLPELTGMLTRSGAARPRPLTVTGLARRVAESYDPVSIVPNANLDADGQLPEFGWDECGPTATEESIDAYWHDSGISRVWEALRMPPGTFTETVLAKLLGPDPEAPRKRVTLIYHPVPDHEAPEKVDRDVLTALNRAGRRKGVVRAHDDRRVKIALQAADEEAAGAGIVRVSMLVTGTVTAGPDAEADADALDSASTAISRAGLSSRIRLKPVIGGQSAAFAAGLGIGLVLGDLSAIPETLRANI